MDMMKDIFIIVHVHITTYYLLLDNLMADLLADENNLKYIVGE